MWSNEWHVKDLEKFTSEKRLGTFVCEFTHFHPSETQNWLNAIFSRSAQYAHDSKFSPHFLYASLESILKMTKNGLNILFTACLVLNLSGIFLFLGYDVTSCA
jgi:hypothetical protein